MSKAKAFELIRDCPGRFPVHVVDAKGIPQPHLTVYANKAGETLSAQSVSAYLGEVLRVFSWAAGDRILQEEGQSLLGDVSQVRRIVSEYLVADCRCVVRYRQDSDVPTSIIVRRTNETRVNVKMTLAAMKHFYGVLGSCALYSNENPLVSAELVRRLSEELEQKQREFAADHGRTSPSNSGGVDDNFRSRLRYSTNFFQLADGEWKPQIITDPRLPSLVYKAGERSGWALRSEVIARMLFESAGRVSDVVLRTLADWLRHDCLNRMASDSKGSYGQRVKTLAFSTATANLLRRYFNTERATAERGPYKTLGEMQRAIRKGMLDPMTVPIFLSRSGKQYSPNSFRDDCWRPALKAAGILCQPHQARHWCVTASLDQIDETSSNEAERARRRDEFVTYMRWRSGKEMLKVYDHTGARAAAGMTNIHEKMHALERRFKKERLEDLQKGGAGLEVASPGKAAELEAIFKLVDGDSSAGLHD